MEDLICLLATVRTLKACQTHIGKKINLKKKRIELFFYDGTYWRTFYYDNDIECSLKYSYKHNVYF